MLLSFRKKNAEIGLDWDPARPSQESPGRFGPGISKESPRESPGASWPGVQKVSEAVAKESPESQYPNWKGGNHP